MQGSVQGKGHFPPFPVGKLPGLKYHSTVELLVPSRDTLRIGKRLGVLKTSDQCSLRPVLPGLPAWVTPCFFTMSLRDCLISVPREPPVL